MRPARGRAISPDMPPFRGWSTWNAFGIDGLSADGILENAAEVARRLAPHGYSFVNVDDGFFYGRDDEGNLVVHPERFPEGMRNCLEAVRDMGLKTGIYSDAGRNTCGYYHNGDVMAKGCGLENHESRDIQTFLSSWGCDLVKVDWCGGWLRHNKQHRYTHIGNAIRAVKPDAIYSVCCWQWPGEWVTEVADSWRVGPDLEPNFGSVLNAVKCTKHLWKHASSRKFNDLDLMQLGNGMGPAEERSHFAMWCMLNSPVLLSTDLPGASRDLIDLVTNPTLLRVHDDALGRQAICTSDDGACSVWKRGLDDGTTAVAVLNSSDERRVATVRTGKRASVALDAWSSSKTTVGKSFSVAVPPRDCVVLTLE